MVSLEGYRKPLSRRDTAARYSRAWQTRRHIWQACTKGPGWCERTWTDTSGSVRSKSIVSWIWLEWKTNTAVRRLLPGSKEVSPLKATVTRKSAKYPDTDLQDVLEVQLEHSLDVEVTLYFTSFLHHWSRSAEHYVTPVLFYTQKFWWHCLFEKRKM